MSTRETDALERWCPFVRITWAKRYDDKSGWHTLTDPATFNRVLIATSNEERPIGQCIGSKCMAWRTTGAATCEESVELVGLERIRRTRVVERRGYCGLAGSPGLTDFELTAKAQAGAA